MLNEKRQAVISHAVTKGLNPNAPMKPSGVEWLGDVPKHWVVGGLPRFIGPVVDYRGRTPEKLDSGMFLVTARNIRNGKIDYEASEEYVSPASAESLLARGRPEIGDLLFTMEAPLGSVAQIEHLLSLALSARASMLLGKPRTYRSYKCPYFAPLLNRSLGIAPMVWRATAATSVHPAPSVGHRRASTGLPGRPAVGTALGVRR